jgi:hypothetical protein
MFTFVLGIVLGLVFVAVGATVCWLIVSAVHDTKSGEVERRLKG